MSSISPLRYPGGKARFSEWICKSIEHSGITPRLFAEPFCGGCGVSLSLLEKEFVNKIAINDLDPLIYSFWRVVFGKTRNDRDDIDWLIQQIEVGVITVDMWKKIKCSTPNTEKEIAFKCLFLNRTSFNGIIHKAGPIGGWEQKKRTLDVRFNREKLINKINTLYDMREKVDRVCCQDWKLFCNSINKRAGIYLYLDPPYYHKAEQLYGNILSIDNHKKMKHYLARIKAPWMLSYDDAPEVRSLYANTRSIVGAVIDQTYSAHPIGGARFVGRELFFSNRPMPIEPRQSHHKGMSIVGSVDSVEAPEGLVRVPAVDYLEMKKLNRSANKDEWAS
ncbi:MAG: DNA adenine methylase [Armatimonas sp.]